MDTMPEPSIDPTAAIAPGAQVLGDVRLEQDANVWYNAVLRADLAPITVGRGSNIQDGAVLHVDIDTSVVVGENVTVGHGAILHGCTVGDGALVGMGAIVLNRAHIGRGCIIGAGALVTQGKEIPDNSVVLGNPGRIVRETTEAEREHNLANARGYVDAAHRILS